MQTVIGYLLGMGVSFMGRFKLVATDLLSALVSVQDMGRAKSSHINRNMVGSGSAVESDRFSQVSKRFFKKFFYGAKRSVASI